MREMYNSTFVYLKNFVLLYFWIPDSGFRFRILDFRFRIPVSGFQLLGLPMNFLVKMASMVQNKSIFWLVVDQKRFTGKIGIEFYIGGQSSNFLKFRF